MPDIKQTPINRTTPPISTDAPDPAAVGVEPEPMPDKASKVDADKTKNPPARSGPAPESGEKPTESENDTNPTRHRGRMPPNVSE
ncbi:hypothetical protein PYH37_003976 [Sinorhizobium numidicum]|uniref:Uncharacterized protein n=1 Tax=Sinorhizobium numidicum TaxID=680248 RepID=A0ABY8CUS1_9HYPH|nr:hypothetical protein [Sinorhizobium numidicum]WEX79003.1 hypothetical protein PYH37_003976 [Sinorhizobium numidicum]WEX82399.1 hypothetical protein PYH38_004688 [Sinorhizobium numidicum]